MNIETICIRNIINFTWLWRLLLMIITDLWWISADTSACAVMWSWGTSKFWTWKSYKFSWIFHELLWIWIIWIDWVEYKYSTYSYSQYNQFLLIIALTTDDNNWFVMEFCWRCALCSNMTWGTSKFLHCECNMNVHE